MIAFRSTILALLCWHLSAWSRADVLLNEVMACGSERLLRWDANGVPRLGFGTAWCEASFVDSNWFSGNGPFGFGSFANVSPVPVIGTNMATQMQILTPTLYLRKVFTATAGDAASTSDLTLEVSFNDGFVCYLNGIEVARRNAGPVNEFKYRDSFAAMGTPAHTEATTTPYLRTETITLGTGQSRLVEGSNVLAIHALNYWESTSLLNTTNNTFFGVNHKNNFYFKGDLKLAGVTLVASNGAWKYLPGVVEPSGGFYDPALLLQARQIVPWGQPSFDDVEWAPGAAPFGAGTPPSGITLGTNLTAQIPGQATSLYCRIVFTAIAADLADPKALQLLMDWDDGFVAYINGLEVARDRLDLANSFTPHDAVATGARTPGSYGTYNLDPPARLLIEGQNVLAVQVHNVSLSDSDLFLRAQLRTNSYGTNRTLVASTASWKYFVGLSEPVSPEDENIEDNPEPPDSSPDWVELHNAGLDPADLGGWRLSDDPSDPAKWVFPAGASITAGGYLVVMCDGLDITEPGTNGLYHTNFKLSAQGESVGLSNAEGTEVDRCEFGEQTAFDSYGRDAGGAWVYLREPTPGTANSASTFTGRVAPVQFSQSPGFYPTSQTILLTTATPGATIRYTLDGTEPEDTTGTEGAAVAIDTSQALRARAFKAGMMPSRITTGTFLINESTARQSVPALCLVGDQQRSLYRPYGVMAIRGGAWTNFTSPLPLTNNGIWTQTGSGAGTPPDLAASNNVFHRGRFTEQPVNLELLRADGAPGPNIEFGLRISGSNHARPRYRLTNQNRDPGATPGPNDGAWSATDFREKPSFDFFFRNEFGGDPLEWPLFPDYPVNTFHDVRVRAGKNDVRNPFIEDEYVRRLFISTGQQGSIGMINTLYVNGVYKGYYNLCEHVREDFLQRHHGGGDKWDVRQVSVIASGDGLAFQEMITYIRNNPQNNLAAYQGMKSRLDMVNFIDYLLTNIVGVTGDWPHNNFICARERVKGALHRYYVWDAEGAFGDFGGSVRTNMFVAGTTGSVVTNSPLTVGLNEGIRILYTLLRASPEFKLLFADRIQQHFFHEGALTEAKMLAEWNAMKAKFAPLIAPTAVTDRVTPWFHGVGDPTRYTTSGATNTPSRRNVLFHGYYDDTAGGAFVPPHFVAEGLWPATLAPEFSHQGGTVAPGYPLVIANPNGAGAIYYTRDGSDPRAEGGTVQGVAYTGPLVLSYPGTIKARVLSSGGEWSPLLAAFFDTGATEPLIISEIMYHPADGGGGAIAGDEYEFLEIKNIGAETIQLGGMSFTAGISYRFADGASIAPGTHRVLARSASRFSERYPAVTLSGTWGDSETSLSNSGETLTLTNGLGRVVFRVTWSDADPWPATPDGGGLSLVPVNPNIILDPDNAVYWRPSATIHGSPGADDPPPPLPVFISEVFANSEPPEVDWVELHNPNGQSVDISHWWLSDSDDTPQKFRVPDGTIIPAGGYLVFTETDFAGGAIPFAFSSYGERARLSAGSPDGALTGFVDNRAFGASDTGASFGRQVNSQGTVFFVLQKQPTPAAPNAGPLVGPVAISEIMYNPATGGDEFLELRNVSSSAVPLFDPGNPANTWKLEGIAWSFPTGVALQPGQIALLTPLAPETFRTKYDMPGTIAVYGPFPGSLDNGGERLRLQRPGLPFTDELGVTVVPFIDADVVTYDDVQPWPENPDGGGPSLERLNLHAFGDDPGNWRASPASGGTLGYPAPLAAEDWRTLHFTPTQLLDPLIAAWSADPDGDGINNFREWAHGLDPWNPDAEPVTHSIQTDGESRFLQLHVRRSRSATGLEVFADTSSDLASGAWNLGAGQQVGSPEIHGDGTETITFRHPVPIGGGSTTAFLRARLQPP